MNFKGFQFVRLSEVSYQSNVARLWWTSSLSLLYSKKQKMSWNKLEILCYSINGLYLIILFDGVSENKDAVSILQFIQLLKCATQ